MTHEVLRELPLFAGLSHEDLHMLEAGSQTVELSAGTILMEEGTPGGSLYVILEGEFEIVKRTSSQDVLLAVRGPGEVIGEMSLLDQTPRTATVRALSNSVLLQIDQEAFRHLLEASPGAAVSILRTVTSRLRNTESMVRQNEKMAALGTLAAGLAHELNNPAAALVRAADHLRETLVSWVQAGVTLAGPAAEKVDLESFLGRVFRANMEQVKDPMELSRRESSIEGWLADRGVNRPWDIAPALAAAEWREPELEAWSSMVPAEKRGAWLAWLGSMVLAGQVLSEVALGAKRITDVVSDVKSYTYLDRAPVQRVDVHADIDQTLVILRHKLEPGISIVRRYAMDLPTLDAHGSELNQVWTNLIDNAAQAMNGRGELTIATTAQADEILVEFCDNGPGIPAEIQHRIFEPFFTTKPPGAGTGLGLHLVYNIVVHRHGGRIDVRSRPGETCFSIRLPIRPRGQHER